MYQHSKLLHRDRTRTLLNSLAVDTPVPDFNMDGGESPSQEPQIEYHPLEGWGLYQTYGNAQANLSQEEEGTRLLTAVALGPLQHIEPEAQSAGLFLLGSPAQ